MNIYRNKNLWKLVLLLIAVAIGLFSLLYTQNLVNILSGEKGWTFLKKPATL